jgi:hypothetical protein
MIDALRFVQGAVASKDFVPELTHFRISAGHIMGFNGRVALCSPIDLSLDVAPKATTFTKALLNCGDKVSMHLTDAGRLAVRSDGFRVFVECIEPTGFHAYPEGDAYPAPAGLLDCVKTIAPFMGEDASRPWCMALHISSGSMYATNNIIAVEQWLGGELPALTIPHNAVREIIRIGLDPISLQTDGRSLTLWYGDGKWLRTQLVQDAWPVDRFKDMLNSADPTGCVDADPALFAALDRLKPFMVAKSKKILLLGDRVSTHEEDGIGASQDVPGLPARAAFDRDMLALVGSVATTLDLAAYPAVFYTSRLRGVIMGMQV